MGQTNELKIFNFQNRDVRVIDRGGEPWFVGKDVAGVLGYSDTQAMTRRLDADEVSTCTDDSSGQVRRITITAGRVVKDEGFWQYDLFTDTKQLEKEKRLQDAMLGIKRKFGKNAVLKGTSYLDGATMRERNGQIGGHKA